MCFEASTWRVSYWHYTSHASLPNVSHVRKADFLSFGHLHKSKEQMMQKPRVQWTCIKGETYCNILRGSCRFFCSINSVLLYEIQILRGCHPLQPLTSFLDGKWLSTCISPARICQGQVLTTPELFLSTLQQQLYIYTNQGGMVSRIN